MKNINSLLIDGRVALGAFDFDGNILAPETITYVIDRETGEEVGIAAHTLDQNPELMQSKYRWKDDIIDSLLHFRDYHSDTKHLWPDHFKEDIEEALSQSAYSPSFTKLKEVFLIPARICAIITARGHSADNIARILWIMNEYVLTEEEKSLQYTNISSLYQSYTDQDTSISRDQALRFYFENIVSYYPVSNPHVAKYLGLTHETSSAQRKTIAMWHFKADVCSRILPRVWLTSVPLAIGFSDDSVSNCTAMRDYFLSIKSGLTPDSTIHLYFTGRQSEAQKLQKYGVDIEYGMDMTTIRI